MQTLAFVSTWSAASISLQDLERFALGSKEPWFLLGLALGIACHEAGHYLCAVIGSIPIRLMSIGIGPLLLRGRVGETTIELRLIPLAGFVAPYPILGYRRFRHALVILGGILGNLGLVCLVIALGVVGIVPQRAAHAVGGIILAQLFIIFFSVVPYGSRGQASDGLLLLQLAWRRGRDAAQLDSLYGAMLNRYGSAGQQPATSAASSRVLYHLTRPDRWTSAEGRRDVREALGRELARGKLPREEEILVLDALATDGLIFGEAPLRLEEWSARALQLAPETRTLHGTRGAVLVELGRYEEGKALLEPIAAAANAEGFDAFMSRMYLARAERVLGNTAAARHWAAMARKAAEPVAHYPLPALLLSRLDTEVARLS